MRIFQVTAPLVGDPIDISELSILFDVGSLGTTVFPVEGGRRMSTRGKFTFGIITPNLTYNEGNLERIAQKATEQWKVAIEDEISICQTTYSQVFSERGVYGNYDAIALAKRLNTIEMANLVSFFSVSNFLNEYIFDPEPNPDKVVEKIASNPYYPDVVEEIERIRKDTKIPADQEPMIPVSYFFKGSTVSDINPAIKALLDSLYACGRLRSRLVIEFDFDQLAAGFSRRSLITERKGWDDIFTGDFVNSLLGNTVVITYGKHDNNGEYEHKTYRYLQEFLKLLSAQQHRVQVIFIIPEGNPDLERRLLRAFPVAHIDFLPKKVPDIQADFAAARSFVLELAAKDHLEADQELFDLLDDSLKDKSITDPAEIFNQWRQRKLVRSIYPQYAESVELEADKTTAELPSAHERLQSLIGLKNVKTVIENSIFRYRMNRILKANGLPVVPFTMHAVFLGSPGTGKTEVARLYAEILKEEGVLSEGRLINYSGSSGGFGLEDAITQAKGSLLFIDEAYALRGGALTLLIEAMENNRHDFVVILAGYEKQMEKMISINPGFASRIGVRCIFQDYSPEELTQIFDLFMNRNQLKMSQSARELIRDYCHRPGRTEEFGNARDVRKLFEDVMGQQQLRLAKRESAKDFSKRELLSITKADVLAVINANRGNQDEGKPISAYSKLQAMTGLGTLKTLVNKQINFLKMQKLRRDKGLISHFKPMHMVFSGNPGTGKTEVAKLMADILREEGILSKGELFHCGRQDLVGEFVGHTAPKVHALFEKARGSVIFIDEAYSLLDKAGSFGEEAITTLIDDMEKYRDEVVVILAGYKEEMAMLLDSNPGFKSRVKFKLHFPDYSAQELLEILHNIVLSEGFILEDDVDEHLLPIFELVRTQKSFGNGRFVRNVFESALFNQSNRLLTESNGAELTEKELQTLTAEDFSVELVTEKRPTKIGFSA